MWNCHLRFWKQEWRNCKWSIEEFSISKEKGLVCLPIGYTGGTAKEIFENLSSNDNLEAVILANKKVDGDISLTVENIIKAVNLMNKEDN